MQSVYKYCKVFYNTSIIGAVVDIYAIYPITKFILNANDDAKEAYKKLFSKSGIGLRTFMEEVGLDYWGYGNAFVSIYYPFEKMCKCSVCKGDFPVANAKVKLEQRGEKPKWKAKCPKCKVDNYITLWDRQVNGKAARNKIKLIRWSPELIDVESNPVTGICRYKYLMPAKMKKEIISGNQFYITTTPQDFLDAVAMNKNLIFNSGQLIHMRSPSLSSIERGGLGEAKMLRAFKDIYYLMLIKKAREVIAHEHVIPLHIIFPQASGTLDPIKDIDLQKWRTTMENEIKKWRKDPNYKPVMPFPAGHQFIGGSFKNLDTSGEIRSAIIDVLATMGVPQELIYGGMSWSGASITLRLMAERLENYRQEIISLINDFIIPKISTYLGFDTDVTVHMSDLHMADDMQRKQMAINMNNANKLSWDTALSEFGWDQEKELKKMKEEIPKYQEIKEIVGVSDEKIKGKMLIVNTASQMQAQIEANEKQQEMAMRMKMERAEAAKPSFGDLIETLKNTIELPPSEVKPVEFDPQVAARYIADNIVHIDEASRKDLLNGLRAQMPELASLVTEQIMLPNDQSGPKADKNIDMRPMPEQKPPRRKGASQ
jgi:hypothetical protein